MTRMQHLTDLTSLAQHRARAQPAPADFLQSQVADEMLERLEEVNRAFTNPAIVTGHPQIWADLLIAKTVPDSETLDLAPSAHDVVLHALSLHWANDPVGQLVQCRRALKPDGLMLATLFGGQTLHELRTSLAEAEVRTKGGLSARVAPMGEVRDLGALLQRAGFALPVADSATLTVTYESPLALMADLRAMGESNALAARPRHFTSRKIILEACKIYAETFGTPDGRIPATFEIITLTGWAPAESQPQPLRPGSATQRLADALKTDEVRIKRSDD